ncbi:3-oxoacyl-[acyl-carrier-protein] synthase-3 [Aurantimicrobium minutum]|uniref:3-oxoacyl-ACP synthase III family protein n=1 Tax=Aurantimicrobium minutum TaxID=708131 RepID=UPI002472F517|nr:ketoacyl-ACP synthase III [Aurantimicrobium minutum]MDH6533346.1 3-oxoacyl-[acyl-carrier-protein] synthase-3 [Aurantimicrobium minutum]
MNSAKISSVSYYLPERILSNSDIAELFPEWSVEKISAKTGISTRHIAATDEFASDMAVNAAKKLFHENKIDPNDIEYIILSTQTPDYYLPSTACIIQDKLGVPTSSGATDITLGCSGYVYALGLAKGLVESGQVSNVLVLTSDTYSKFINEADKSVRTIFGDAATATLVELDAAGESISGITYGTDGSGAKSLIVPNGGLRKGTAISPRSEPMLRELNSNGYDLYMDGPDIFNFTIKVVPEALGKILTKADVRKDEIDLFVFHQANAFMLDHLRKKLEIEDEKFIVSMSDIGNTVSSTIPIALSKLVEEDKLKPGMTVLLLGFGVGLSWGGMVVKWR